MRPPKYVFRRIVTFSTPSVPILAKLSAKGVNPETHTHTHTQKREKARKSSVNENETE
jgi:hypothetical protein